MKTHQILFILLGLVASNARAQFTASYPSDNSLRGYDILRNDGKYIYTCGSADASIFFEIDPSDGSLLNTNPDMGNYIYSGKTNGVGKQANALAVDPAGNAADNAFLGPVTLDASASGSSFGVRKVDYGAGSFAQSSFLYYYNNYGVGGNHNNRFDTYSDQATYDSDGDGLEDYYFFTGTQRFDPVVGTSRRSTPFIFRRDKYGAERFRYIPELYDYEEVPTRIVVDDAGSSFVSYGSYVSQGSYVNNATYRDAGIVALGTNMWAHYSKTYHLSYPLLLPNRLGAAQSVILDGNNHLVFVASGDNPMDPGTNRTGDWDWPVFHIVKTDKMSGNVVLAKRIEVEDIEGQRFARVQVADIIRKDDGYVVTGTASRGVATGIELNTLFVMELDASFQEIQTKKVYFTDVNPYALEHVSANKIRLIDDEIFITGSYEALSQPGLNVPFLVKMKMDLEHECAINIGASIQEVNVYDRHRPISPDPALYTETLLEVGTVPVQVVEQGLAHQIACDPDIDPNGDDGNNVVWGAPNDEALGLTDQINSSLVLFPNPVTDQITISGLVQGKATIVLVDVHGKSIWEFEGEVATSHSCNLSTIDKGVYFFQVTQNGSTNTMKLLKE